MYAKKALAILTASKANEKDYYLMTGNNTIGIAYNSLAQYDSALKYYQLGLDAKKRTSNPLWRGFITDNIGQAYYSQAKYKESLEYLAINYNISQENKVYDDAASALQLIAEINLKLGKPVRLGLFFQASSYSAALVNPFPFHVVPLLIPLNGMKSYNYADRPSS